MRTVCRGSVIVCNPVNRFRLRPGRAHAQFDGINEFQWWLLSEAALRRMMLAVGFAHVDLGARFELPARAGGRRRGLRGYVREPT